MADTWASTDDHAPVANAGWASTDDMSAAAQDNSALAPGITPLERFIRGGSNLLGGRNLRGEDLYSPGTQGTQPILVPGSPLGAAQGEAAIAAFKQMAPNAWQALRGIKLTQPFSVPEGIAKTAFQLAKPAIAAYKAAPQEMLQGPHPLENPRNPLEVPRPPQPLSPSGPSVIDYRPLSPKVEPIPPPESPVATETATLQDTLAKQHYGKAYAKLTPDQAKTVDIVSKGTSEGSVKSVTPVQNIPPPSSSGEPSAPSLGGQSRLEYNDKSQYAGTGKYPGGIDPAHFREARAAVNADKLAQSMKERGLTVDQVRNFTEDQWKKEAAPFWKQGNMSTESRNAVIARLLHKSGEIWPMVEPIPPPPK